MASTYTTNIRLTKQGDGDNPNSWGLVLNNEVIDLVDSAIAAYTTISCSSADVTLTESNGGADQSRSAMLEFVGTVSSNINIIVPTKSKFYIVNDQTVRQSSSSITIKTGSGSGSVVDASAAGIFFSDAVSVYSMNDRLNLSGFAQISSSNTFTASNTFNETVAFASAVGFATSVSITQAQIVAASVSTATINKATFIKQVAGTPVTLTDAASIAVDFSTGTNFVVSLGGNRTLENPSNAVAGQTGHIYVIQDSTGSRTLAFGDAYNFQGGTAPTMSTSVNSVDLLVYNTRGVSAIDTMFVSSFG